jgi:hypothetical protein
MSAFDTAWQLFKESASKEEYRAMPTDEFGFLDRKHIGAQDFELSPEDDDLVGGAELGIDGSYSRSRVHPSNIGRRKDREFDAAQQRSMATKIGRISAHEATHQAIHSVEPSLRNNSIAQEYGAYAGESAQDAHYEPKNRMDQILRHPQVQDTKGIERILEDLVDGGIRPDRQAQTMGERARWNAQRAMEEEESEEKWYNAVHGRSSWI